MRTTSCQEQPIAPEEERSSRLAGMLDTSGPLDVSVLLFICLFNLLFTLGFWENSSNLRISVLSIYSSTTTRNGLFSEWHVGTGKVQVVVSCLHKMKLQNSLKLRSFDKILTTHWVPTIKIHDMNCGLRGSPQSWFQPVISTRTLETASKFAPEIWWLEDEFSFVMAYFKGLNVSFQGVYVINPKNGEMIYFDVRFWLKTAGNRYQLTSSILDVRECECESQIRTWQRIRASKTSNRFQSRACLMQMFGKGW